MNIFECFYCNEVFDSPSDVEVHVIKHFDEEIKESDSVGEAFMIESNSEIQTSLGTESTQTSESLLREHSTSNTEVVLRESESSDYYEHHNVDPDKKEENVKHLAEHANEASRESEIAIDMQNDTDELSIQSVVEVPIRNHAEEKRMLRKNLQVENDTDQQCEIEHANDTVPKPGMKQRSRTVLKNHEVIQNKKLDNGNAREKTSSLRQGKKEVPVITEKKAFRCDICFKTYKSLTTLKRHLSLHPGIKHKAVVQSGKRQQHPQQQCPTCGHLFSSKQSLSEHMLRKHKLKLDETVDEECRCDICNKTYIRLCYLKRHIESHGFGKGRFECDHCGKIFCRGQTLRYHMNTHTDERPCVCETCGKRFREPSTLFVHKLIHIGDENKKCCICHKRFATAASLETHQRLHIPDKRGIIRQPSRSTKRFQCTLCNKKFGRSSSLKLHLTIHAGERNFQCQLCGRLFNRKSNLNKHTLTHTGEKPHRCGTCGKCYSDSSNLRKHEKKHELET